MCIVHQMDLESPAAFACAQPGCRECRDALVRRHEGLVHWRAVEQANRPQGWLEPQELPDAITAAEKRSWWTEVWLTLCTAPRSGAGVAQAVIRLPDRPRQAIMALCGWDGRPPRNFTQLGSEWGINGPCPNLDA